MAIGATAQFYTAEEMATRLLPAIAVIAIDPESKIRDQGTVCPCPYPCPRPAPLTRPPAAPAFVLIKLLVAKLERASKGEDTQAPTAQDTAAAQGFAASAWVGWAVGNASKVWCRCRCTLCVRGPAHVPWWV